MPSMPEERAALMRACIVDCLECYSLCREQAARSRDSHAGLLDDCAKACALAADFMLCGSRFHAEACELCARLCEACASECAGVAGMEACERACRGCAISCRGVAGA